MLRILVVEDDQKLCRIVCNHLNSHGYEATGYRQCIQFLNIRHGSTGCNAV